MRRPSDIATFPTVPRRRLFAILAVLALLVVLFSLRTVATLWTDSLWFNSLGQGGVFSTLLFMKVGLFFAFGGIFATVMFLNLLWVHRHGRIVADAALSDELVRTYHSLVAPRAIRLYALISALFGFIAGGSALGQWQNYLLFSHSQSFHRVDPLFHNDLGFYIFTLPFYNFLVKWAFGCLLVTFIVMLLVHRATGGIRIVSHRLFVEAGTTAHLSLVGALLALTKAVGYLCAKWSLVTSGTSYVTGAGYADAHARIPALSLLFWVSIAVAGLFLFNAYRRTWSFPALGVSVWVIAALVVGEIYPAALQTITVTPAQSSLELPYIARNIAATRAALNLSHISRQSFEGSSTITAAQVQHDAATLSNIRLWDPSANIALETVQRRQALRGYYTFPSLEVDRYPINGVETPVLVGVRQVSSAGISNPSWVNTHLEYTHGMGAVVLPANTFDPATGNPIIGVGNVPPVSTKGLPTITQPAVYFGLNQSGWVATNTKQGELDYSINTGANAGQPVLSHYAGGGGVQLSNWWRRSAFALRFGDLNLWISDQITSQSRMIFTPDVVQMAQKAAPFLTYDAHPYAVLVNGHVDWVLDGYTTSSNYPYSENASTQNVPSDTGLPGSYNYVRNAVKVVVDAYSGQTTFYAFDNSDPLLAAYRSAFPHLFTPLSMMPSALRTHLRYPQDLFNIQAAMYGRYHITSPSAFYTASDRWQISPTRGAGAPNAALSKTFTTDAAGNVVGSSITPMDALYEEMALPHTTRQQLTLLSAYVPAGSAAQIQGLSGFLMATSDPGNYGQLTAFVTPRSSAPIGPVQADSEIQQNTKVSSIITPLDQHGSTVLLGNNVMVPLDQSVLYVRPLYVSSQSNPLPQLKYVIAVFDQNVAIEPTLAGALADVFGLSGGGSSTGGGSTTGQTPAQLLGKALAAYTAAQADLTAGNLAGYQSQINLMNGYVKAAQALIGK